nr:uncharacterized protein LOC110922773 [Ipomoea batatas]
MQPPEPQQKESQQIEQDDEEQDPIQMQTEKSLGKEPQRPETRTEKRQVKPTNPLKSPYLTRQVDMKRPWTATEKIIGKWVLQNDNVDPPVWGKVTVNDHSATILYTVVAPYGDNALRTKRFTERMDNEIRQTEGLNLQDIELFVFPIVHSQHYFVLTVNVKNKRFDILDNSSSDSPGNEKYGDVPTTLTLFLPQYTIPAIMTRTETSEGTEEPQTASMIDLLPTTEEQQPGSDKSMSLCSLMI